MTDKDSQGADRVHKWWEVIEGDCRSVMAGLEPECVDAIVCDPPYELGFMGKGWDSAGVSFEADTWRAAWRVLKPGGHLLAFGGTRTYHRIAVAIEDAGFEIRDCLSWLYGSGFPKSLDVSKAIDKTAGAEREVIGERKSGIASTHSTFGDDNWRGIGQDTYNLTAPATPEAAQWAGWGTALKPAWEPIIVARKPLVGTVAANVLQHGTGALNVDACRIGTGQTITRVSGGKGFGVNFRDDNWNPPNDSYSTVNPEGRWPANVALDEAAAELLDAQTGERIHGAGHARGGRGVVSASNQSIFAGDHVGNGARYGDTGGASRFYYVAKASRRERNAGLEGMPIREVHRYGAGVGEGTDPKAPSIEGNHHPTVKPIALMRWLVRLVTAPGGLVLDPFNGSGSTGIAAVLEGFRYIGIEQSPEYAEIARRRIAHHEAEHLAEIEEAANTPAQLALNVA